MNYFWSFLFIALSLNAAYNPFFHALAKPKKAPELAPSVRPMPLPPLLKPAFESLPSEPQPIMNIAALRYCGFLETEKGRFALVKVGGSTIVLKEADPVYIQNRKCFVRNITSNYITVDDAGKTNSIYFTTGDQ
jgi:hypothetical protein